MDTLSEMLPVTGAMYVKTAYIYKFHKACLVCLIVRERFSKRHLDYQYCEICQGDAMDLTDDDIIYVAQYGKKYKSIPSGLTLYQTIQFKDPSQ